MYNKKCPYCNGSGEVPADNEYDGKTPKECADIIWKRIMKNIKIKKLRVKS